MVSYHTIPYFRDRDMIADKMKTSDSSSKKQAVHSGEASGVSVASWSSKKLRRAPALSDETSSLASSSPNNNGGDETKPDVFTGTIPTGVVCHIMDYVGDRKTWNARLCLNKEIREASENSLAPVGTFKHSSFSSDCHVLSSDKKSLFSIEPNSLHGSYTLNLYGRDVRTGRRQSLHGERKMISFGPKFNDMDWEFSENGSTLAFFDYNPLTVHVYDLEKLLDDPSSVSFKLTGEFNGDPILNDLLDIHQLSPDGNYLAVSYPAEHGHMGLKYNIILWNVPERKILNRLVVDFASYMDENHSCFTYLSTCRTGNDGSVLLLRTDIHVDEGGNEKDVVSFSGWNWQTGLRTFLLPISHEHLLHRISDFKSLKLNPEDPSLISLVTGDGEDSRGDCANLFRLPEASTQNERMAHIRTTCEPEASCRVHHNWFPCGKFLAVTCDNVTRIRLFQVDSDSLDPSQVVKDAQPGSLAFMLIEKVNSILKARIPDGFKLDKFSILHSGRSIVLQEPPRALFSHCTTESIVVSV